MKRIEYNFEDGSAIVLYSDIPENAEDQFLIDLLKERLTFPILGSITTIKINPALKDLIPKSMD